MGLLDDLIGPIRDIASVKNEVTQSFAEVKDSLVETRNQVAEEVSGVSESLKDAAAPVVEPSDASVDDGNDGNKK